MVVLRGFGGRRKVLGELLRGEDKRQRATGVGGVIEKKKGKKR